MEGDGNGLDQNAGEAPLVGGSTVTLAAASRQLYEVFVSLRVAKLYLPKFCGRLSVD